MNHREWLAQIRATSTMEVVREDLDNLSPWGTQVVDLDGRRLATFGRDDGKFFRLAGFRVGKSTEREVPGWTQPLVEEVGQGFTILVHGENEFIVSARAEPGNEGYVFLGPTLQASRGNYEQAHGGSAPPRAELYNDSRVVWSEQPQDGGRFYRKSVRIGILKLTESELDRVGLLSNERMFTESELLEAIREGNCNSHLVEAYAHYVANFG